MKNFAKKAVTGLLLFSMTATAGLTADIKTAEALSLGDLGNFLGVGGKQDLETSRERMFNNFYYSTALLLAAYQNIKFATDDSLANRDLITQEQATKSAVKSFDAGLNMKNGAEQNKADAENMKQKLSEALATGDEEKLKEIDRYIKEANNQRLLSDVMAGVSSVQITIIMAAKVKSVIGGNYGDISDIITIANDVSQMLKVRSELSKILKTSTQEYRKTRGIKDPNKKEQKAAADEIEKG